MSGKNIIFYDKKINKRNFYKNKKLFSIYDIEVDKFQVNPLSYIPLPINSLHSHLHLSFFQCCLLLQTLVSEENLDYANCKCRKRLTDNLVEDYSENIDEKKLHSNEANDYEKTCSSYSVYIVLLVIFFILSITTSSVFIYFHWHLKKSNTGVTNIIPST